MTDKQVRNYDKFMLRFPDGMREAIAERARKNGRSMNSEIIQMLEEAMDENRVKAVHIKSGEDSEIVIETNNIESFAKGLKEFADAITTNKIKALK
ncbi:Arc family DNA-binding protein [Serratia sp. TMDUHS_CL]|uniref:Arc family DNA-binding protein n=1 Tax=Serratia sp. TMDUHS_CL TaxID=3128862 RepID=UPI00301A5A77